MKTIPSLETYYPVNQSSQRDHNGRRFAKGKTIGQRLWFYLPKKFFNSLSIIDYLQRTLEEEERTTNDLNRKNNMKDSLLKHLFAYVEDLENEVHNLDLIKNCIEEGLDITATKERLSQ